MAEASKTPPKEDKPKGLLGKLKEASEDKEEQMSILSTFVRLEHLGLEWCDLDSRICRVTTDALKIPKQDLDPTFIASVFTGVLATFGVQAGKSKSNGSSGGANISKKDMEILIEKASQTAPAQVVRIEQSPCKNCP